MLKIYDLILNLAPQRKISGSAIGSTTFLVFCLECCCRIALSLLTGLSCVSFNFGVERYIVH